MKRVLFFGGFVLLSACMLLSCGRMKKGAAGRFVERNDERIKKDVVEQLYWDSRVDASGIEVTVEEGNVRLEGTVLTRSERVAAANDAWSIAGVRNVENRLALSYERETTYLREGVSGAEVKSAVLRALESNALIDSSTVSASVSGGLVTLEGTVDTVWKRERAEEIAADVNAVTGVKNMLSVVPTESISDEVIARDIADAMDRNAAVNVDDVKIEVRNGVVTLSGTVPSPTARRAAVDSAFYAAGVREVRDLLSIG